MVGGADIMAREGALLVGRHVDSVVDVVAGGLERGEEPRVITMRPGKRYRVALSLKKAGPYI
jgi:hypothetical protein